MKKIIPVLLVALLLSACTTNATENKEESVYPVTASMSYTIDLSNPSDVAEQADYVALVHIGQIEGADNYSTLSEEYTIPYTYGKMTVLEVLQGDLAPASGLRFYRIGGTISYDRYFEGLSQPQQEKLLSTLEKGSKPDKIKFQIEDNIDIEENKDYLVYLKKDTAYAKEDGYGIICFAGGLREVKAEQDDISLENPNTQVFNNFTQQWENLTDVIK